MALPQNLLDDLATLDADSTATSSAVSADQAADQAVTDAANAKTGTAAAVTKATAAQATQLALVKADLDAIYGTFTPTPAARRYL